MRFREQMKYSSCTLEMILQRRNIGALAVAWRWLSLIKILALHFIRIISIIPRIDLGAQLLAFSEYWNSLARFFVLNSRWNRLTSFSRETQGRAVFPSAVFTPASFRLSSVADKTFWISRHDSVVRHSGRIRSVRPQVGGKLNRGRALGPARTTAGESSTLVIRRQSPHSSGAPKLSPRTLAMWRRTYVLGIHMYGKGGRGCVHEFTDSSNRNFTFSGKFLSVLNGNELSRRDVPNDRETKEKGDQLPIRIVLFFSLSPSSFQNTLLSFNAIALKRDRTARKLVYTDWYGWLEIYRENESQTRAEHTCVPDTSAKQHSVCSERF